MTSAKKSVDDPIAGRGASGTIWGGEVTGAANASALDTLCACGLPVVCGGGRADAPSAPESPFGIERVLRRRRDVGGERETSKTVLGGATGPIPLLNTETGRNECTDMRERRFMWMVLVLFVPALGGSVVDAQSSSCPDAAGADDSR